MNNSDTTKPQDRTRDHCETGQCPQKGHIRWLIIISILLIITNVLVLAVALPYQGNLRFDYYGAIVGILSLIVMVLVTWNIYTYIDIKESIKQINNMKADIEVLRQTKEDKKMTIQNPNGHAGNSSDDGQSYNNRLTPQ